MKSNQSQIRSADQQHQRREFTLIHDRLTAVSKRVGADFIVDHHEIADRSSHRLIKWSAGDLIPDLDQIKLFDQACQASDKKLWIVTDNIVSDAFPKFQNVAVRSYPEIMGVYSRHHVPYEFIAQPSRLYNCFMQRCDPIRQSWFYFLWLRQLLDRGYVSYLLYQNPGLAELPDQDLFDHIHYQQGLDSLEIFRTAHAGLRSHVPYRNFVENQAHDVLTYIQDSKYSIILETYATMDDQLAWCFTEKTLRSIQTPTANLLFVQKHSLPGLMNLGLEIDSINQEFDSLDWQMRQQRILEILVADEVVIDADTKYNQCMHNRSLLSQWQQKYHDPDFFSDLEEEIWSS